MMRIKSCKSNQRGATLVEFAIGATVFLTAMFAVLEFGRALWTHNALTDAARRGARYATLHAQGDSGVKNVIVYGNAAGTGQPLLPNLSTGNVTVTYSNPYQINKGTVSVSITGYQFQFVVPIVSTKITMPNYTTTLTAESVGLVPANK